ncbi:sigma-54-dependent Fis family transcriptional regulator [Blastopirellula marina]|uniref:Sigma-54-dependent Fis family transcriptional regulator n=1 Tax=Blastopirellula marina TaxID=124 RepID=A0A2S8F958_9BACT|nr:sigma-54-dependent Fis family transcriptional regulator [Blastopirellula marina]PQO28698.1 sigma-54-dependent Fis family transcriptional regulator [Blastopirellula marina]PTL41971.1 sigma-54-dependent Fis family transcriptional regulator [Blastopirellula marina]
MNRSQHDLLAMLRQTLPDTPQLGTLVAATWEVVEAANDLPEFSRHVCQAIQSVTSCSAVQIQQQQPSGDWKEIAASGPAPKTSASQLGTWLQAEITPGSTATFLLALPGEPNRIVILTGAGGIAAAQLQAIREIIHFAWQRFLERLTQFQRATHLKAVLSMVQRWHQTDDLPSLLNEMAESSTQFFAAERASIFLWDKPKHILVGRPALGVEEGKLVVPDDKGVVGAVVQTGQPRRVDDMLGHEVNRDIDKQLEFHTRSLLCVPLLDRKGKVFGAFELINKRDGNFTTQDEHGLEEIAVHAAAVLESSQQIAELLESRDRIAAAQAAEIQLIGQSPPMLELRKNIDRISATKLPVLVLGENGTGKEVVSRMIHYHGNRRGQPLVSVNCAALPDTLLESELFGHEKGAFTGAHETKPGKFELASGGTLFLDEIGDMSLPGQAKLLRVLENQVLTRLGGQVDIEVDVRVIAATNQDLPQLVKENRFRQDLFYRLDVISLHLPPLRDRGNDILILAERFLAEFARKARRETPMLSSDAKTRLLGHMWPGNIRELRNTMERTAFLCDREIVTAEMLPLDTAIGPQVQQVPAQLDLTEATNRFQADFISYHLERSGGNMSQAAKNMGLHRSNLHRKMKQLGLLEERE